MSISTTNTDLRTVPSSGLTSSNVLFLLAACGKIHILLRLLAVKFSISSVSNVCTGEPHKKKTTLFFTSCGACVLLQHKNLLRHILPVHFLGLHCIVIRDTIQQCFKSTTSRAISCFIQPSNCGT